MDEIIALITEHAGWCERAAREFQTYPLKSEVQRLQSGMREVSQAWSRSWLGYHACLHFENFATPRADQQFDPDWGLMEDDGSSGWNRYSYEEVRAQIIQHAGVDGTGRVEAAAPVARAAFGDAREAVVPILDALIHSSNDDQLRAHRQEIVDHSAGISQHEVLQVRRPKNLATRDTVALQQYLQDPQPPPHIAFDAWLMSLESRGAQAGEMARLLRRVERYLVVRRTLQGGPMPITTGTIFIGHGHSQLWRELKDFIQDRLKLTPDEFNMESAAGVTTTERLEQMLSNACFAFLVMTAEDEHADGTSHARENVIHEAGLFQGRLGFKKAIVLLEEGCVEFSNISGLGQIRFPKGNLGAKKDEIRHVLERENILPAP